MSFKSRLIYAFVAFLALMAIQTGVTYYFNQRAESASTQRIATAVQANVVLGELQLIGQQLRRYEKEYFIYIGDAAGRAKYQKEWTEAFGRFSKGLENIEQNDNRAFGALKGGEIKTWQLHTDAYGENMRRIFSAIESLAAAPGGQVPPPAEANQLIRDGKDRFAIALAGIGKLSAEKSAQALEAGAVLREGFKVTNLALLATALLTLGLAAYLAHRLPVSLTTPIGELTRATDRMSKGDLDFKVDNPGVSEFTGLVASIERMRIAQQMMLQRLQRNT